MEPLILGLILAPSAAGAWLAVSAVAAFLTRHPLKLAALDRRRGARYPRTHLAERFFASYAAIAALAFITALWQSSVSMLTPLALAAPAAFFALWRDLQGRGREVWPEIAGALALGSSATAIILAGGGASGIAWLAWALGGLRVVTAILYVRARVRIDRSTDAGVRSGLTRPVLGVHVAALLVAMTAVAAGRISPITAGAFGLLLLRAAYGLAPRGTLVRPQVLGIQEVFIGVACLGLFAAGLMAGR
ncbi:MAG: YwiC-like family protein [Vicinamibacteria bacterium]|nr:YwiC-like family protein [Vicinamibacteria bacterium]